MKSFTSLVIIIFHAYAMYAQTFIPGGVVSGAWNKSGNPYLVQGNISIPQDSVLLIHPGVSIIFQGSFDFTVYGVLRIMGSSMDSVLVTAADTNSGWLGLKIYNQVSSSVDSSLIRYAILEYVNNSNGAGGAIYTENSVQLLVSRCSIRNNEAEYGAGIFFQNAPVVVNNCRIYNNVALNRGGGLYLDQSAIDLQNSEIASNIAMVGGGAYVRGSDANFIGVSVNNNESQAGGGGIVLHEGSDVLMGNCEISNNLASGSGGGIAILENSQSSFEYCNIQQNQSIKDQFLAFGGGVFITGFDNYPIFTNCMITGNYSGDEGGGIYSESDTKIIGCLVTQNENGSGVVLGGGGLFLGKKNFDILNSTFSSNQSSKGSSIYLWEGTLELFNSIFWDTDPGVGSKIFLNGKGAQTTAGFYHSTMQEGEASIEESGSVNLIYGPGMKEENPIFKDPKNGDFRLKLGSPCIDSGMLDSLAILLPDKDIDSMPRISGNTIDMGCYEFQGGTSVNEDEHGNDVVVFPVPCRDIINIVSEKVEIMSMALFSETGIQCLTDDDFVENKKGHEFLCNTSNLPTGVYFCRILISGGEIIKVVIKK